MGEKMKKKKRYRKKPLPTEYRFKDFKEQRLHRKEQAYISR